MNKTKICRGVVVPMITPFTERLSIDVSSTEKTVNHIIEGGALPFILGTTGESASVSGSQRKKLVRTTVSAAAGRSAVYAGISNNSIIDSIEEAKSFSDLGVSVLVSTMPSYYPVEPDQILRYYEELADAVPLPLIIYNIPATTNLSIPLEIVDQLSAHHNIIGLKDSENNVDRMKSAISLWKDRQDFSYLVGCAALSNAAITLGADGIVPSSGNLVPHLYSTLYSAAKIGDKEKGSTAQTKTNEISAVYQKGRILSKALPALKAIMSAYDLCGTHVLPPMYKMSQEEENRIKKEILHLLKDIQPINKIA